MTNTRRRITQGITILIVVAIWQIGSSALGGRSRIPPPLAIAATLSSSVHDYIPHIASTVSSAAFGLVLGLGLACMLATLIQLFPAVEWVTVPAMLIFSIPLIVLVPIIGMTFSPEWTPIICSVLLVYYPVVVYITAGLRNVPREVFAYASSTGTDEVSILLKLRARFALPGFAAGVQSAIPAALLGSMLGELTGTRWGLGAYLLAVMAQANPAKEWSIFIVIATLAGALTSLSSLVWKRLGISIAPIAFVTARARLPKYTLLLGLLLSIVLWEGASSWAANPFFVKGPMELWRYSFTYINANGAIVVAALGVTLKWVILGLVAGLLSGLVFAGMLHLLPVLRSPLLGIALVTQTVPIVALVPLCVSVFGRGPAATMAITIAATFFLCFTAVHQGFEATPKAILDFALSTGASRGLILGKVRIPAAIPFLFAAARVTVARVFLGVTLAEYLATRQGLGALLFEARGTLDFGLMWLIACCAGMISLVLVGGVSFFEERALLRYV